jgi:hypothetical protein
MGQKHSNIRFQFIAESILHYCASHKDKQFDLVTKNDLVCFSLLAMFRIVQNKLLALAKKLKQNY